MDGGMCRGLKLPGQTKADGDWVTKCHKQTDHRQVALGLAAVLTSCANSLHCGAGIVAQW